MSTFDNYYITKQREVFTKFNPSLHRYLDFWHHLYNAIIYYNSSVMSDTIL